MREGCLQQTVTAATNSTKSLDIQMVDLMAPPDYKAVTWQAQQDAAHHSLTSPGASVTWDTQKCNLIF